MKENLNMGGKYSTADFGKFSTAIDNMPFLHELY